MPGVQLFYLTMDVTVKRTGIPIKRTMVLEEEARPAQLRSCNPWGECKFSLQMRKGGLVRVYDSVLVAELEYKAEPHLTHRNDSDYHKDSQETQVMHRSCVSG